MNRSGIPWGVVKGILVEALPSTMDDRERVAYHLVPEAVTEILGPKGVAWDTERRGPKNTTFVVRRRQ